MIVDATMKAKLNKMQAANLTGSIAIIFQWLKAGR